MVINGLRQEKDWSQEKLAEISGLSLRTIQRIEGSDSVSPDSLGALAAAFDMEFATLEKELAMDKTTNEWKKRPAWVRGLFFGSGRVRMRLRLPDPGDGDYSTRFIGLAADSRRLSDVSRCAGWRRARRVAVDGLGS